MTPAWLVTVDGAVDVRFATRAPPAAVCRLTEEQLSRWRRDRSTPPAQRAVRPSPGMTLLRTWYTHGPAAIDLDGELHVLASGGSVDPCRAHVAVVYDRQMTVEVAGRPDGTHTVTVTVPGWHWHWQDVTVQQFAAIAHLRRLEPVHGLVVVETGRAPVEIVLDGVVVARAAQRAAALRAAWQVLHREARDATLYTVGASGRIERIE